MKDIPLLVALHRAKHQMSSGTPFTCNSRVLITRGTLSGSAGAVKPSELVSTELIFFLRQVASPLRACSVWCLWCDLFLSKAGKRPSAAMHCPGVNSSWHSSRPRVWTCLMSCFLMAKTPQCECYLVTTHYFSVTVVLYPV